MFYKPRTKPKALVILDLLDKRTDLTGKDKQHYLNLKKGYEGEMLFDTFTEKLQCDCLILNDLLLEINNTTFQIDALIIVQGKIHFFEVKNHEGDYYYQSDKLFKKPKLEVLNPLDQLSRSESLLRQLLLSLSFTPHIDASVVFINPNFTLYQAPLDKPLIFPTQVNRHMDHLNKIPAKPTVQHKKLADQLLTLHKTDSPYSKLPSYDYEQIQKGITCSECKSFSVTVEKRKCVCGVCGYRESVTNAVLRTIKEFQVLFPDKKITSNIIHDWCMVVESKRAIRRILADNFNAVGKHQWTYYE
ncbi:nuclease-related domain-containing protein [Lentibacillus sediminis]|uniref:nuclease-related domain-containing protein n=1 Tax=Lentibacillus sediminis TaxID=1940529 RepID=UPI000C1BDBE9|nr:nuclease-related domain-containing protein [Lentibacillus sediminis]